MNNQIMDSAHPPSLTEQLKITEATKLMESQGFRLNRVADRDDPSRNILVSFWCNRSFMCPLCEERHLKGERSAHPFVTISEDKTLFHCRVSRMSFDLHKVIKEIESNMPKIFRQ